MVARLGNGNTTAMDVSTGLGLYVADKQKGPFKDLALTFSDHPSILHLKGNIIAKCSQLERGEWGMSTNLEAAFERILEVATKQNVAPEDMPKYLLILSDMEFNVATRQSPYYGVNRAAGKVGAHDVIKSAYAREGYTLPAVIYWNLNGRVGNSPVSFDEKGTVLISGFSPSILSAVLRVDMSKLSPVGIMEETLSAPRYARLKF